MTSALPPPPPDTASALALREILALASRFGLDSERALQVAGITPSHLADTGGYVPTADFERLLRALITGSGDPTMPLRMASEVQPGTFGIVSFIAMVAPTMADVVTRAVEFERLLGDFAATRVEACGDDVLLVWDCRLQDAEVRQAMTEGVIASWAVYARWLLDDPHSAPREAWFAHAAPPDALLPAYEQVFRAPVRFGQAASGLRVPATFLGRRLRQPDPVLFRTLDAHARERLAGVPRDGTATARVADAIRHCLAADSAARKDAVAARLGMNPRTMLRRLGEEDTTFQDVLDEVRRQLAVVLARDSSLDQSEVAVRLGFTENRSLQRAFRRWTGVTFSEFRARGDDRPG